MMPPIVGYWLADVLKRRTGYSFTWNELAEDPMPPTATRTQLETRPLPMCHVPTGQSALLSDDKLA